jgi:hypothetical protein
VEEWSFGEQDVLSLLAKIKGASITARLYYSGLENENSDGPVSSWRAFYQTLARKVGPGPLSPICDSWFTVDSLTYGGVGLDELLVTTVDGKATSVGPRVFGSSNGQDRSLGVKCKGRDETVCRGWWSISIDDLVTQWYAFTVHVINTAVVLLHI